MSTVMSELGGEKIDIIEWSDDAARFVEDALSPARVESVVVDNEANTATVNVADDQQSLAIGRGGQNVRLAAKLTGYRIDNPFMWTADDKFFGASLITKLGVASPKTVVLPNKEYVPGIVHNESLRNLIFPIPWQEHVEYLGGFPVVLKDAHGGGWKQVHICRSMQDLWNAYNQSGLLTMVLQEFIRWDEGQYLRCMCLGQQDIKVMKYDPDQRRYLPPDLSPEMHERVVADSLKIVRAFGYDMNTIEWAIRDGVPYAIDFMNPAPDMDINTTGVEYHRWCVEKMADLCIDLAENPKPQVTEVKWSTMFNG